MQLFDSHCHLQDERLAPDLPDVMAQARAAGVVGCLCCGTAPDDWPGVARLAAQYPEIVPAFGLHPWFISKRSARWLSELRERLVTCPSAAVGEIGLDHAIDERDDATQTEVFMDQMRLAAELGRPVSVHCRRAWAALLECLGRLDRRPPGLVIHSFSGSAEIMGPLMEAGAFFSFSGSITRPANRRGHEAVRAVPLDRLLIETDAPDIMPLLPEDEVPEGSRQAAGLNEPANVTRVIRRIAELRDMPLAELADRVWQNTRRAGLI